MPMGPYRCDRHPVRAHVDRIGGCPNTPPARFGLWFASVLACGLLLSPWGPSAAGAERQTKNVLFIAVDDLNTRIACYGDPTAKTPHLDRLASWGVRFERAYCQFPICNPSRVSLLLGRYPTTTETVDFAHPALLGDKWVSLTQHYRNQDFDVQLLGKIYHFGTDLMKGWFSDEAGVPGQEFPPDWRRWREMGAAQPGRTPADGGRSAALGTLSHVVTASKQLGQEPPHLGQCVRSRAQRRRTESGSASRLRMVGGCRERGSGGGSACAVCRVGPVVLSRSRFVQAARAARRAAAILRYVSAGSDAAA